MLSFSKTCLLLLLVQPLTAEIKLTPLFQDGAVLQRETAVPVWGWADANSTVTVKFAGQEKSTTANDKGQWQLELDPLSTNAQGQNLTATESSGKSLEIKDILVGEVWLASGQSNMEWPVSHSREEDQKLAASGSIPLLRLFQVPKKLSHSRLDTVDAHWQHATPQSAHGFSAIAYFFGRKLTEELNVPVGMINSSWGGSRIEPWWAEEGLEGIPELEETRAKRLASSPGFSEYDKPFRKYLSTLRQWTNEAENALDTGNTVHEMPPAPPLLELGSGQETGTYQAMIHPLVPYALRGFLWYQGESNNGEGMAYTAKQHALMRGWRLQFRAPSAPFLFVQLAPYNYGDNRTTDLPGIWWAQQETLKLSHTGMAVITDIGNIHDIHPTNKSEVARRLALWALSDTYGKADIVKSGPLFSEYKVVDQGIAIRFDHIGSGLTTRDGKEPNWFEIAGKDNNFHPAKAQISNDGKTILLTSPGVPNPDRARFAWSQLAEPNLMNKEGLPAAAFNTHWPSDPTLGTKISQGKPHESSHPNPFGWDRGLTDGIWGNAAPACYATDPAPDFPKHVTVDLGEVTSTSAIIYGTPDVGSTKTIAISISTDGQEFRELGRHEFAPKNAERHEIRFDPTDARFVRATFIDHHPKQDGYDENFAFLSELEVYTP